MRTNQSKRTWTSAKHAVAGGDRGRALIVGGGGVLLLAFIAGTGVYFGGASASRPAQTTMAAGQQDETDQQVGAMLIKPQTGQKCWERRFDYGKDQIVSDRVFDCGPTLTEDPVHPAIRERDNTVRIQAILDDFKKRR
jgi:hypothetical protein